MYMTITILILNLLIDAFYESHYRCISEFIPIMELIDDCQFVMPFREIVGGAKLVADSDGSLLNLTSLV